MNSLNSDASDSDGLDSTAPRAVTVEARSAAPDPRWQQGELVEITITDLSDSGDGVGRHGQRVVFVPDTVTGDRVRVRLVRVKPQYANGKLVEILEASPHRVRPSCIVADKCGGCQWQHVSYEHQLVAKRNQVVAALGRIGGFSDPEVAAPIQVGAALGYRNKSTYPFARSKEGIVQAGYYQKGSHILINLNQCPIQDERLNPLLAEVKKDIYTQGWGIYDETEHRGKLRHLSLRVGRRTGEMLLTLVAKDDNIVNLKAQAEAWMTKFPSLVGVFVNVNPNRTNAIFGATTTCVLGRTYLEEKFAGLTFQIRPETFFQVYTEQAEAFLEAMLAHLDLKGDEVLLDAYCGIGTLTLPLAKRAKQVVGIEMQPAAVEQALINAELNGLTNVSFQTGTVEKLLSVVEIKPDIIVLDPPRKGCEGTVVESLRHMGAARIVYMSCNPATLARDLKAFCADGMYRLEKVITADLFPQTSHVESIAFLTRG